MSSLPHVESLYFGCPISIWYWVFSRTSLYKIHLSCLQVTPTFIYKQPRHKDRALNQDLVELNSIPGFTAHPLWDLKQGTSILYIPICEVYSSLGPTARRYWRNTSHFLFTFSYHCRLIDPQTQVTRTSVSYSSFVLIEKLQSFMFLFDFRFPL